MTVRRVAVLEPLAHLGGAEISLLELLRRLNGDPHVTVILPEDGPLQAKIVEAGADTRILQWPRRLITTGERSTGVTVRSLISTALASTELPRLARRLDRLLDDVRADMLLTNGIKCHVVGALTAQRARRPVIWYLREVLEGRRMSRLALRALAPRCRGAIAISHYVEREARSILPKAVPSSVLYNLVDFDRFRPDGPIAPDLGKRTGEIWFGTVGAVTPLKGQDLFLRAAANVAPQLPLARFVIVGSNFYSTEAFSGFEQELRRLAAVPALQGRVTFLGQRPDVPLILRTLDVVVQANRGPEALGRAILEAMASGVPVIGVDRWGPAEIIADGRTGLLTPLQDVAALTERMLLLGTTPQLRKDLGQAAANWVRERLEPETIVDGFRNFLRTCLS